MERKSMCIREPTDSKTHQNDSGYEKNLENLKDKYVACQDCLGYFKRNYLRRHRSNCTLRLKPSEQGNREDHLSAAQLFVVCSGAHNDFYSTLRLKNEVFPIL
ncbi:hypothetical protein NQ314_019461 [Rhamnusium bicolor]|uniref:C2H2-type domain-containing protein n=1 Tax=Rhamnusium bicolor TaxID=1586634 RepID=A0AAV8WPC5_9CUCU|nr:hypothetical protein NQ314_019461 [Rhamnusium bicolor]